MDPDDPADPLDELEARLRETRDAARRLRAGGVPPQGWAVPPDDEGEAGRDDVAALIALVRAVRDLVPAELRAPLNEALRQVLLVVRALVDRLIEALERADEGGGEPDVEDIPIA
jgi:hypothetical protein